VTTSGDSCRADDAVDDRGAQSALVRKAWRTGSIDPSRDIPQVRTWWPRKSAGDLDRGSL